MSMEQTSPYDSKIPHEPFSNEPAEQKEQLAANPLLQNFKASRQELKSDPYSPIYHLATPDVASCDPYSLCHWQGRWHLFYSTYPQGDFRAHFGHTVSEDLVHWRDLPYAIYPGPEKECWYGTAWVEEDRVICAYYGLDVGIMVAVSSDPLLLNWDKLTGQAVIPVPFPNRCPVPYTIFDPCVWEKDRTYYCISAGTMPHIPSYRKTRAWFLFRSPDLKTWEYLHPFSEGDSLSRRVGKPNCSRSMPGR
jgi:beta-fructofuranosidase